MSASIVTSSATQQQQRSPLLQCLARIDIDTWAQVLLPKLIKQGSATTVALACSELRDLCYGAVQHLNLSKVHDSGDNSDNSTVEDWVQSLPQHFPHCTSVQLQLGREASYHTTPYLLPALARLPRLETVQLRVLSRDLQPLLMGTLLFSMRTQLSSMRCLSLQCAQSWVGAAAAWRELARLTGLSSLNCEWSSQVEQPVVGQDLLPLASLRGLQELSLVASNPAFKQPLLPAQLAAGLTSLAALTLSGNPTGSLVHVSSLRGLTSLAVFWPLGALLQRRQLGADEWAALGQLSGLVELDLMFAHMFDPSPECCAALRNLKRLQGFGAWLWQPEVLPALTACTQLTRLTGGWQQDGDGSSAVARGLVLPSVVALHKVLGWPPFAVFPNLQVVLQRSCMFPAAVEDMAWRCPGLMHLMLERETASVTSLPASDPVSVRIPAIQALSSLQRLRQVHWMVADDAELRALVGVAGALLPGLQQLCIYPIGRATPVRLSALMHLAKLQRLNYLVLQLARVAASQVAQEAENFLGALSGIWSVVLSLEGSEHVDACLAAAASLRQLKLPRPKYLTCRLWKN